nr:sphingomyelin phosphodiesterase 4-like isoform X1 [Lytechinus pictus]
MAASMSWDRLRRGVSTPPKPAEKSSSLTGQVQSLCGLHYPLRTRCFELESLIRRSSSKDLHSIYTLFLDLVFGLNGHPGWGLHTLNCQYSKDDFKVLQDFMSPNGPVFLMVYKLQGDHYLRYEFPVEKLPAPTRASLADGIVPPFYQGKLAYQSHGRTPSVVMLNAFEYFMYIFAYYLVSERVHKTMNNWSQPQDYFYPVLLDQYLCYFLRSDGRAVPPIPVTSSAPNPAANRMSPYRLPQYGVLYHYLHSSPYGGADGGHPNQRSPTQHHDTTLGLHHQGLSPAAGLGRGMGAAAGISFQQPIQDDPQVETWRSEVLVQALTEFWLNQNSLQLAEDKSFLAQVRENFIPSPDHVRMVRILVKRLHFFVNSARPMMHQSAYQQGGESAMEELKRYIMTVFVQKPLYVFLRHGFDNWPLDSSFRQILELWLSYIQPWRYVEETNRTGFFQRDINSPLRSHLGSSIGQGMAQQREPISTRSFPADDERWPRFVQENLPFYTVLFQELLPRIFHQDLSIPNNALMVYRMAKVFGQPHLSSVMKNAEENLIDLLSHPSQPYTSGGGGGGGLGTNPSFMSLSSSIPSSTHLPPTLLAMGTRLYTHLLEEEAPGFMYRPLFDSSGKAMIEQLLGFIAQAQTTVKTMAGPSLGDITQTIKSFFTSSLRHANHSALFDDIGPVDTRKAEAYLQSSGEFLSDIFDVPLPHPDDTMAWNVGQIGRDQHLPPDMMDGQLTPLGRFQLINRLRSSDVNFQGDPDLQPIRSYENAALVRMLHALSCQFNDAFGDKLLEICSQGGLLGAMARWYFNPRGNPHCHPSDPSGRVPSWYRPRLSLRFLANYRTLTYLAILYLLLVYFCDIMPTGFVAFLLAAALFVGFLGSLFTYLRGDERGEEVYLQHYHHQHGD